MPARKSEARPKRHALLMRLYHAHNYKCTADDDRGGWAIRRTHAAFGDINKQRGQHDRLRKTYRWLRAFLSPLLSLLSLCIFFFFYLFTYFLSVRWIRYTAAAITVHPVVFRTRHTTAYRYNIKFENYSIRRRQQLHAIIFFLFKNVEFAAGVANIRCAAVVIPVHTAINDFDDSIERVRPA